MGFTGKEIAEMLVKYCNTMTRNDEEFVEQIVYRSHRTLQQSVFEVFLNLCKEWSKCADEQNYDLRNEYTVKKAKLIMAVVDNLAKTPFI